MQSFFESHVCVKTGILRGLRELASHQFPNTFQKKKDLTSSRLGILEERPCVQRRLVPCTHEDPWLLFQPLVSLRLR
jgi:hypothetical protein